jgi:hypothetical protein
MTTIRTATAAVSAFGLVAGALAFVCGAAAEGRVSDKDLAAWVEQRIADWQPTRAERRFDEIAWAKDIREAERLAKEHHRPIFYFTHDGHMGVGRC